jgi:UTP-glucose-1-phosphate uridylyltransferase
MLFVSPFCQNQCLASLQQIRCSQCVHPGNSAKYKSNKEKTKLEIKCYLEVKGKHAVIGRYLFKQSIFNLLEEYNEKEIGLSNVIFKNVKSKDFIGCKIQGKRFDIGNIDDYYKTIVNIKKRL